MTDPKLSLKKKSIKQRLFNILKWMVSIYLVFKIIFFVGGRIEMRNTIKEKSDIGVSYFFSVVENEVYHTPSAFDSDYTWTFKLKIGESTLSSISEEIENSKFYVYQDGKNQVKSIYDSISTHKLKGYWRETKNGYEFFPSREAWAESTTISINKRDRTVAVELVHL